MSYEAQVWLSWWQFPGLEKKPKILSSFTLTAQSRQNIGSRSDQQVNDTDKRAYSHIHPPQSC